MVEVSMRRVPTEICLTFFLYGHVCGVCRCGQTWVFIIALSTLWRQGVLLDCSAGVPFLPPACRSYSAGPQFTVGCLPAELVSPALHFFLCCQELIDICILPCLQASSLHRMEKKKVTTPNSTGFLWSATLRLGDLFFQGLSASTSQGLGLKMCATSTTRDFFFFF